MIKKHLALFMFLIHSMTIEGYVYAAIIQMKETYLTIVYLLVLKVFEDRLIIRLKSPKVIASLSP